MTAEPIERAERSREPGRVSYGDLARTLRVLASHDHPDQALLMDLSAQIEDGQELRPAGRARKVSVSMPEDLATAVQQRVGRGAFSQYVSEAVARQLELDLVAELAVLLEAEFGPVPSALLEEAAATWPDAE